MRKGSELRKEQGREREEGNEKREFEKKLGTCLLVQILVQTCTKLWRHNFEKRCVMLSRYCPLKTHKFVTKCNRSREIFLFSESAQNTKTCNCM